MLTKRILLPLSLICGLLFNYNIFASSPPTIQITIDNPNNIPLTFTPNAKYGNVCVSQNPSSVLCTIYKYPDLPDLNLFILTWSNTNNPDNCQIHLSLYGGPNTYYFFFDSDYNGMFTPSTWDGKSDVRATLKITTPRINGC